MRKFASTILIVCLSQICLAQQKTITGKLSGFKDNTKVKLFDQEMMSLIDSTYIQNGKFIFKNPIDNSIPKVLSVTVFDSVLKFIVLFIANDNVEISGDIKDFPYDLKIIGSKTQSEQSLLNEKFKSLQKERDEIVKFWRTEVADKNESYQTKLKESNIRVKQIDQVTDSIKKQYINSHINSYVSLRALSYLKKHYSTDELQSLYSKLEPK